MSRTFALVIEYDGTDFAGSQLQPNARTVQGVLEETLAGLLGQAPRVRLAGRTDSGVHALGQVAAFETESALGAEAIMRALNALLPEDLAVGRAWRAEAGFDPRRQALSRVYRYVIYNRRERSPLWRGRAWHIPGSLEREAVEECLAQLPGRRDFASFSASQPAGKGSVRDLRRAELRQQGDLLCLEFEANAFLPHQVRRTAGALVEAGRGRLTPLAFQGFLEHPVYNSAGPAAPPEGLYLVAVRYPADGENSEDLFAESGGIVQGLARP
jgi:tRNA pseudouridine38-40 synthase